MNINLFQKISERIYGKLSQGSRLFEIENKGCISCRKYWKVN